MKLKTNVKLVTDILMSALVLFLFGYQLWGEAAHEWAGIATFILFILHHILNGKWHRNILKGGYTPLRTVLLITDILITFAVMSLMYSGITVSKHIFTFLPSGNIAFARRLHILGSYWGFILLAFHFGLHISALKGILKLQFPKGTSRLRNTAGLIVSVVIAVYGVYAFIKRGFPTYLFLKSEFVFMDYSESKLIFYADLLAIAFLFAFFAFYTSKFLKRKSGKQNENT